MADYENLPQRLRRYSENLVAYKLDAAFADAVQKAADAIEDKPRWISVEERLPDEPGTYLVFISDPEIMQEYDCSYVSAAHYDKDEGLWKEEDDIVYCADLRCVNRGKVFHITHWMHLPPPPDHIGDGNEMVEPPKEEKEL